MKLTNDTISDIRQAEAKRKASKERNAIIVILAAQDNVTTIEQIVKMYPRLDIKSAKTMLSRIKKRRKELAAVTGHKDVAGVHNPKEEGYVYLIENESSKGWVKCGMTTNLAKRLQQYNFSDPLNRFVYVATKKVSNRNKSESLLLYNMKSKSLETVRSEWFRIDKDIALQIFDLI